MKCCFTFRNSTEIFTFKKCNGINYYVLECIIELFLESINFTPLDNKIIKILLTFYNCFQISQIFHKQKHVNK